MVNGEPGGAVDADDRGLRYGDGVFETIALHDGRPLLWVAHWVRLVEGCHRLGIEPPPEATLRRELERLAPRAAPAVGRIVVTRGPGGDGYGSEGAGPPTRVVAVRAWPRHRPRAARVRRCRTRLGRNPALAGIKHLNRLEQVLAARELGTAWDEGLLADTDGHWIEGTRSNLFLVTGGELLTPALTASGVAGVMRAAVIDAATELGIAVRVTAVDDGMLGRAEELFLCNALAGVWPVALLEGRPVGSMPGPGPVTARIAALLAERGAFVR